jgi:phage gp46-like protein
MDYKLNINGSIADMTWEKADTILNNVYLSLMVKRGTFFQNPDFGMRSLARAKNTKNVEVLAKEYCLEALQWIKDSKKATKIDVFAQRDSLNRMKVLIEVVQADGRQVNFETFLEVV